MVYHDKFQVVRFINQNTSSNNPDLYLTATHGAMRHPLSYIDPAFKSEFKVHTPILYWEDQMGPRLSLHEFNPLNPYENQAMDVGVLCPPACGK
jgi:hypothetical protein